MNRSGYLLSSAARVDVLRVWNYLAEHASIDVADKIVGDVEAAMQRLADTPGLGHSRTDLTRRPVLFCLVQSYLIVYRPRTEPAHILRILHASRNIQRILNERE